MKSIYNNQSFILFSCILIIILFYFVYYLYIFLSKYLSNYLKYKTYNNKMERFGSCGDSNSKRNKMIKIYKSDNIVDPDDSTYNNKYDDDNDPDSTYGSDPDS